MKFISRACRVALLLLLAIILSPIAHADSAGGGHLAFLSASDRAHLIKVRREVLANDANLKSEQESLSKERQFVKDKGMNATADDRQTLAQNFMAHNKNMQDAMVKADPTVAPVLDEVAEKMKSRHQQRQGADDSSSGN